ncbi:MAG: foldase protein PrsA [Lachnospiraceae bacterium]|jgi:foldase protein PrsA
MRNRKVLSALCAAAVFSLSGCGLDGIYLTDSTDTLAAAGKTVSLTAEECSLIFLNYQSLYNEYYRNAGMENFWYITMPDSSAEEETSAAGEDTAAESGSGNDSGGGGSSTFADTIKNGRVRDEVTALILLGDIAADNGTELTEEESTLCSEAAREYYETLSDQEISYTGAALEDVETLYRQYRVAQDMIAQLTADAYLDISDNDRRVINIQALCVSDEPLAEELHQELADGADFTRLARENSLLGQIEFQVSRGELNPLLEEPAFLLDTDEISEVIPVDGYYYILKCVNDFNESESRKNESRVLDIARYSQWSQDVISYSENDRVLFLDSYWDEMTFTDTDQLTADGLYTIYLKYFPDD